VTAAPVVLAGAASIASASARHGRTLRLRGQVDNTRVAPGVVDRVFHLLPRHD
jgi:hypothetical protein